jgi:hypothetical protein
MKLALRFLCNVTLLLILAHRLLAPIIENEEKTVPATPLKSKTTPAKHKSSSSIEGSSLSRFEGTWRANASSKNQVGNMLGVVYTLVIKNGSAEEIVDRTYTLGAGARWPNVAAPYNSISSVHARFIQKSSDVKIEGSNLKIRWPGFSLTDWTPKNVPQNMLMNRPSPPSTDIYILNGDRLIDTNGQTTGTWLRAR